jgi:acyl carrier protein
MSETLNVQEIENTMKEIIVKELGNPLERLDSDTEFATLPGIESIKVLRMVTRIEQRWDIELQDTVVFQIKTFGELRDLVIREISGRESVAAAN